MLERASLLLVGLCALGVTGLFAVRKGWLPSLQLPWHLGDVAVCALGAFCILWGMERGSPEGVTPRPALRLYRLGVLLSGVALLAVWIYG
jgi:hypothetical protein